MSTAMYSIVKASMSAVVILATSFFLCVWIANESYFGEVWSFSEKYQVLTIVAGIVNCLHSRMASMAKVFFSILGHC